jgi:ribonucleoside-diphosphate reductase alpha chain
MKNTSINRMNAGVSIISLAHLMAKQGLKYSSLFGKKLIHRVAETHSYFLHKSALRIGKEYGNARWIDRTRYPDGWFPVDSRNMHVESISYQPLKRDWESLRKEIIDNKGIAFSVLETSVPSESSSMAQDATNSLYPIRGGVITKKDASRTVQWVAPEWETLGDNYELAWDIDSKHITDMYAIVQGFTGQGISADYWMTHSTKDGRVSVSGKRLISEWLYRQSVGMKSRYYINHKTGGVYTENNEQENGCSSGGCTL